jgi:hypothetical protein
MLLDTVLQLAALYRGWCSYVALGLGLLSSRLLGVVLRLLFVRGSLLALRLSSLFLLLFPELDPIRLGLGPQ